MRHGGTVSTTPRSSCSSGSDYPSSTLGIDDLIGRHEGSTVAIVGTGLSLDGYDFGELERVTDGKIWTIGINGAVRLLTPDYAVCCDPRAYAKAWPYYDSSTTLVLGERVWRRATTEPHWKPGSKETSDEAMKRMRVHVCRFCPDQPEDIEMARWLFFSVATLTSALTLADAMGFSVVLLLGIDLYRRRETQYAHDIEPASPDTLEEIPGSPDLYITPQLRAQRDVIERNADRWSFDQVVNLSRHSQLRSWPIDERLALPRTARPPV